MNWDEVKAELQKPLHPDAINQPAPGKFGEYIDGLHAIREANRIFGEDGWSYEVTRLEQTHGQIFNIKGYGSKPNYDQYRCSFLCAVRVNIDGVIREGLAVGTGNGKPENTGDVIESAVKEAETDALKRALRSFGNTFGLALYEKDKSKREIGTGEPEFNSAGARDRLLTAIARREGPNDLEELWLSEKETLSLLSDPHFNEVKAAFASQKARAA